LNGFIPKILPTREFAAAFAGDEALDIVEPSFEKNCASPKAVPTPPAIKFSCICDNPE
jgi:hypothetical protein